VFLRFLCYNMCMNSNVNRIIILALYQSIVFNLAHPITPAYVQSSGIDPIYFGYFFSSMSLGIVLFSPIWGTLADHHSPKKWMMLGAMLYAIGQLGFGYLSTPNFMLLSRFISGIGAAAPITILAALTIVYSNSVDRGKHLAFLAASITLGGSLGYYLGGFMPSLASIFLWSDYHYVFIIQASLTIFYVLWIFIWVKDVTLDTPKESFFKALKSLPLISKSALLFYSSLLIVTMVLTYVSKFLDVYFIDQGYLESDLGTFVLVTGMVGLFTSIFIVPKVIHLPKIKSMSVILIVSFIMITISFSGSSFLLMMYTVFMLYMVMKSLYQPFEQVHIASFDQASYGRLMGIRQFFVGVGMVAGPIAGGYLYRIHPKHSFIMMALLLLLGLLLMLLSQIKKDV
jgi:MFS family permease